MSALFVEKIPALSAPKGTFLCIHGWGFDHRSWHSLTPFLTQDFDLWLVDLPGFGQSACAPESEWLAVSLRRLSDQIDNISGPVFLLGWSLGGQIALQLSLQNLAVRAVFAVATNLQFCAAHHWPMAMDANTYEDFLQQFQMQLQATCKRFAQLVAAGAAKLSVARKQVRSLLAECDESRRDNWSQALQALQTLDLTRARFTSPAHLLLAHNDQLVPVGVATAAEVVPGLSCQMLMDTGHSLPFTAPERVADWLLGRAA